MGVRIQRLLLGLLPKIYPITVRRMNPSSLFIHFTSSSQSGYSSMPCTVQSSALSRFQFQSLRQNKTLDFHLVKRVSPSRSHSMGSLAYRRSECSVQKIDSPYTMAVGYSLILSHCQTLKFRAYFYSGVSHNQHAGPKLRSDSLVFSELTFNLAVWSEAWKTRPAWTLHSRTYRLFPYKGRDLNRWFIQTFTFRRVSSPSCIVTAGTKPTYHHLCARAISVRF